MRAPVGLVCFALAVSLGVLSLTAADPASIVNIPDPTLQAVVRETLNKSDGDITTEDMASLTFLVASRATLGCAAPVQSLEGLQAALNLRSLDLRGDWDFVSFIFPWDDYCATPAALGTDDLSPLSSLGKLDSLYLAGNGFSNLIWPSGLTNLQTLDLGANQITNLELPADMTNLQSLSLDGVTNTSFLSGLTRLRHLTWWTGWESMGEIVLPENLPYLERLTLGSYGLTNLVLPPVLTNLHTLQLFGELSDASFLSTLWNLRILNLNYTRLTALPSGLTNLVELQLDGNPLTNISFLDGLKKLTVLGLSSCTLSNVTDFQFLTELSQLRNLDLSYNEFTSFEPPTSARLTNLVELHLSGNPLAAASFHRLDGLTVLGLTGCGFTNQNDIHFLDRLTRLRRLDLGNNALGSFAMTNPMPELEDLDLRENKLTQVDLTGLQKSLKRVNLSYNYLAAVSFLENFSALEVLDFYTRDLTSFTLPWGLTSLKTLGLRAGLLNLSDVPYVGGTRAKLKIVIVSPNFTYVGIPASTDLSQLTVHGHWKDRITVLGLWMRQPELRPDGQIALRIRGAAGRTVEVQSSPDLQNWIHWRTVVLGQDGPELTEDMHSPAPRFFRVVPVGGN